MQSISDFFQRIEEQIGRRLSEAEKHVIRTNYLINGFSLNRIYDYFVDENNNDVVNAIKRLRTELLKRDYLYDSFAASIESSVKEQGLQLPFQPAREVAEKILDRVIGKEEI